MKLKECQTCGSHSFTDNKCDYCGNQYEVNRESLTAKEQFMKEKYLEHKAGKVYRDDGIANYAPLSNYMKSLPDEEIDDILNNLKDGLTPNQIRTATCKNDLVKTEVIELNQILDSFEDKKGNEIAFKIMIWVLVSVIWFAVTVFIPPLFLITIAVLIILAVRKIIKKIRA